VAAGGKGGGPTAAATRCKARRCTAEILWVKTPQDGGVVHLPLDPEPVADGLLVSERDPAGVLVWRAFRAGRDNAKQRWSVHWDGACKERSAWNGEREAAGELGRLAERHAARNVWGTPFGPCAGCRDSTRLYGPGGNPLCGVCQEVLGKWRAAAQEGAAPPGGPKYR
jgi:hypothetical protein